MKNRGSLRPGRFRPPAWLWLGLTTVAIVLNIWFYIPHGAQPAELPYNGFLEQVRAGNVSRVEMVDRRVRGEFKEAASWSWYGNTDPVKHSTFVTNLPVVDDQRLLPLLEEQGVTIIARPPRNPWLLTLLVSGLPLLLVAGLSYMSARRLRQSQDRASDLGQSRARLYRYNRPTVSFADVAGEDQAKLELEEIVDFLRNSAKYHRLGGRIPRGVLLLGPPGTGKTLLARAVAGEAKVLFFSISASEFVEVYVGVGASRVRDLFQKAKQRAPSIVFVDELDAVGRRRGEGLSTGHDEREQTLNQLLVEMDGFESHSSVIVLAATNRPDVLDPALLRPGRFDRQVVVGLPDREGREGILRIHSHDLPLAPDVDLGLLARSTPGFSGADLANLCNEAALLAARHDNEHVEMENFQEALDKIMLGTERPRLMDERERRTVAYHEAGHALIASLLPGADPVRRVTIIPRGRSLGVTSQLPEQERYNLSLEDLLTRLTVLMGGRAAEQLALRQATTGAEEDFQQATRLAQGMVTRWGMTDAIGPVGYQVDETPSFAGREPAMGREYSETTAALIDQEVKRILQETHRRAVDLLSENRKSLDRLAEALLRDETLDASGIAAVLRKGE